MYTHQFRAPVADFVGRHSEIENIVDFLLSFQGEGCVCSIRGTVGVGKSELAYLVGHHVATHFQDGQIVVTLGGSGKNPLSREQALTVVLRSFLPTVSLPDELSFLEILYRKTLHGKKVIIIADDAFEAEQVLPLLPPPGSALLITSCNRFELPGMFSLDLQPLSSLMSEKLMRESSSRLGPQVDSNLLGRLGGFPLTLRLISSVIQSNDTLQVTHYLEGFENERARIVRAINESVDETGMESGLQIYYDRLSKQAQDVFLQLCVFPENFHINTVQYVVKVNGQDCEQEQIAQELRGCLKIIFTLYDASLTF